MKERLLILDGDGTTSRIPNPFFEVARRLGCLEQISFHAGEYLNQRISYRELIDRQNPIFRSCGRRFAQDNGYPSLDRALFAQVLREAIGPIEVPPETQGLIEWAKCVGLRLAIISSGWDAVTQQAADRVGINYWETNRVLFEVNEFCGTEVIVAGDKIEACARAVRYFGVTRENVIYVGDSDFDRPAIDFVLARGGEAWIRPATDPRPEPRSLFSSTPRMSAAFGEVAEILGFRSAA